MGLLKITYFCKIRHFKRVPLAAEFCSLFLGGKEEDGKRELLLGWGSLLSCSGKRLTERSLQSPPLYSKHENRGESRKEVLKVHPILCASCNGRVLFSSLFHCFSVASPSLQVPESFPRCRLGVGSDGQVLPTKVSSRRLL